MATKLDLSKVYESAKEMSNESEKQSFSRAYNKLGSLSSLLKSLQDSEVWDEISTFFVFFDIDNAKDLTPKSIMNLIPKCMIKDKKVCIIKKNYEREEAFVYRVENGKSLPICKDGKPVVHHVLKLDEHGNKVVKDYTLNEVKTWTLPILKNVLQQAYKAKEMGNK